MVIRFFFTICSKNIHRSLDVDFLNVLATGNKLLAPGHEMILYRHLGILSAF